MTRYDGNDLLQWIAHATRLFEGSVQVINELNVFPVPDGDTGTNMLLTLREVMNEADSAPSASAGETASAMARGALSGARGNSGIILSQFFKGMALGLEGKGDFGMDELAPMLENAREHAYRAIGEPVEGTLLTVMTSVAESARDSAEAGDTVEKAFDSICTAARDAVARTPSLLPVLREAGVVDAGGHGLSVILEGVRRHLNGQHDDLAEIAPPVPTGTPIDAPATAGVVSQEFLKATDEELYGYCTQFLIRGQGLDDAQIRARMNTLALSTVVVGDESMVKVHVHVQDPGPVVSYAASLGTLSQVKMENMDDQHREYASERRRASGPSVVADSDSLVGVVAVAWGAGIESVFSDLGAAKILVAGDTMNPSVQDIVEAVDGVSADNVIFLPNNRNIIPAARQAAELSDKVLSVVPSATIPEGIAAMLAFIPEKAVDDNISEMEQALPTVRTGEVCRAVRPVRLNGVAVEEGQIIGLMGRELKVAGDAPNDVLVSLLRASGLSDGDLVTLYWGEPSTKDDAESARRLTEAEFPGVEVEVVPGGQPHYHYIVCIE
jgi:DAK2 domain fusion protein YloV